MPQPPRAPITVALVDDYDVVVKGVANMLEPYRDRVVIAELDSTTPVKDTVDIVLYDSFAQPESDHEEIGVLVANPRAHRVVVYTWNFHPELVESAQRHGAHGYLSKTLPARVTFLDPPPTLAIPKSRIFTKSFSWPRFTSITLSGLRSR